VNSGSRGVRAVEMRGNGVSEASALRREVERTEEEIHINRGLSLSKTSSTAAEVIPAATVVKVEVRIP